MDDAARASISQAVCLHAATNSKDFSPTSSSLSFSEDWGAETVLQVGCIAVGYWTGLSYHCKCTLNPVQCIMSSYILTGCCCWMQVMSAVTTDISLLHNQLPDLSLRDWAAAATEQVVREHTVTAFGALQERIYIPIRLLCAQLGTPGKDDACHCGCCLLKQELTWFVRRASCTMLMLTYVSCWSLVQVLIRCSRCQQPTTIWLRSYSVGCWHFSR